jgi:hypothetical protein
MKRKVLVLFILTCAIIMFWIGSRSGPPVTLSLATSTNDPWVEKDPTNGLSGIFVLANRTSHHRLYAFHGSVQVFTPKGWTDDTNWAAVAPQELSTELNPKWSVEFRFPCPAGTNTWRCSVEILDLTYDTLARSGWKRWCLDKLRRTGLKLGGMYTVWSPVLVRSQPGMSLLEYRVGKSAFSGPEPAFHSLD